MIKFHGELGSGFRSGRFDAVEHDCIVGAQRHIAPAELRATRGAREDNRELAGEAETDGFDGPSGDQRALGWFTGSFEESA